MRGTTVLAALVAGAFASAQQPARTPASVVAALADGDARTVAIAARHARESADRSFARAAAAALAKWRVLDGAEAKVVCLHLLDASLALDARVPAGDLAALVDDELCGTAAFVLLAREPRHHEPELFALFRRDWPTFDPRLATAKDLRTLAIGNLLAPQAPPGFAALLLPLVDFDVHVECTDTPDREAARRAARGPLVALRRVRFTPVGGTGSEDPAGWPGRPRYLIEPPGTRADAGAVPLPEGSTIGVRIVRHETQGWHSVALPALAADHEPPAPALQWLATAAGLAVPSAPRRVTLGDPEELAAALLHMRERQQVFVRALRRELRARNAISERDEQAFERRVELHLDDARRDRTRPLPLPRPR